MGNLIDAIRWHHYCRNGKWNYLNQSASMLLLTPEGCRAWWHH